MRSEQIATAMLAVHAAVVHGSGDGYEYGIIEANKLLASARGSSPMPHRASLLADTVCHADEPTRLAIGRALLALDQARA